MPHQLAPRTLANGLSLPALTIGSWHIFDKIYATDAMALIRAAVDAGVTHFDVGLYDKLFPAALFAKIHEPLTRGADAVAPPRESVVPYLVPAPPSHTDLIFGALVRAVGLAREDYTLQIKLWLMGYPEVGLREQVHAVHTRFGVEHSELAVVGGYMHQVDLEVLVHDLASLVSDGLIGGWAVANWRVADVADADRIALRDGLPRPQLAHNKYSVARRTVSTSPEYTTLYETTDLELQASDVLEGGLLSGRLSGTRAITPDNGGIFSRTEAEVVPRLVALADDLGATAAQVALGYALAYPHTANVVMGTSSAAQLADNVKAVALAQSQGERIRLELDDLWMDRDVVDPLGSS